MNAKRGYVPEDDRNFSPEAMEKLKQASGHVFYLINAGYDLKQASVFVGNHFLLSERQRLAIMRSIAPEKQLSDRKKRQIPLEKLAGGEVWIDGFNTIITLEVLLSGGLLFDCMDGTVRDLAALRGTYRLIPETAGAVRMLLDLLREARAGKVNILLDEPVSNSGRLKALIADAAEEEGCPFELDIRILRDVDRMLYGKERTVTSDSVVLDHCLSWVNLAAECAARTGRQTLRVWHEQKPESSEELKPEDIETLTYRYRNGFLVDIVKAVEDGIGDRWDVWLYHEDCGYKEYMFGIPMNTEPPATMQMVLEQIAENLKTGSFLEEYNQAYR